MCSRAHAGVLCAPSPPPMPPSPPRNPARVRTHTSERKVISAVSERSHGSSTICLRKMPSMRMRAFTNSEFSSLGVPMFFFGSDGMSMPQYRETSCWRSHSKSEYRRRTVYPSGCVCTRYVMCVLMYLPCTSGSETTHVSFCETIVRVASRHGMPATPLSAGVVASGTGAAAGPGRRAGRGGRRRRARLGLGRVRVFRGRRSGRSRRGRRRRGSIAGGSSAISSLRPTTEHGRRQAGWQFRS